VARRRDFRAEYQARIARASERGLSRAQATGHARRTGEPGIRQISRALQTLFGVKPTVTAQPWQPPAPPETPYAGPEPWSGPETAGGTYGGGDAGEMGHTVHWAPTAAGAMFTFPDGHTEHVHWTDWADYMADLVAEGYDFDKMYVET
jgi:hypothetical protein